MKYRLLIFFIILVSLSAACTKNSAQDSTPTDPGTFTATINGQNWLPKHHIATYFPRWNEIFIDASPSIYDYSSRLNAGVTIDLANPLKKYLLDGLGNNAAAYTDFVKNEKYSTEQNAPDAKGSFTLTKFDTIRMLLSGSLEFTGYNADKSNKTVFLTNNITDIPLKIDTFNYDGSFAQCSISGTTNSQWTTKEVYGKIECIYNGTNKTFHLEIPSIIGGEPKGRYIIFYFSLNTPAGSYQIFPLKSGTICPALHISSGLFLNNDKNTYNAVSGTINIDKIDTAARILNASFSAVYRDTLRLETIQVSNGIIHLNHWNE